jgi:SAM-dependent methyltransferase
MPFLSVLMRTQGLRPRMLEEALTCLSAQTVDNFEICLAVHGADKAVRAVWALVARFAPNFAARITIVPVVGGGRARPLNAALEQAKGQLVACLDDDDLVTADWVEVFVAGSRMAPGSVVRCVCLNQPIEATTPPERASYRTLGPPRPVFARRFELGAHLEDNSTPIMSFAVPRGLIGEERFREDLPVLEDWDFLMRMVLAGGVHDTDQATSLYHWWVDGGASLDQVGAEVWANARMRVRSSLAVVAGSGPAEEGHRASPAELDRIRRTYEEYANDPRRVARWNSASPGNQAMVAERWSFLGQLLGGPTNTLAEARVLEVGSGSGGNLVGLVDLGADPMAYVGVDLLPTRVREAAESPTGAQFAVADGSALPFSDGAFDAVMFFTVLSSVLDPRLQEAIAAEGVRVLRPGGIILWYDMRVRNPRNPNVVGVSRNRLRELFPGLHMSVKTATVAPPLLRALGPLADRSYPLLTRLPFLRTHLVGVLRKPAADTA